MKNMKKKGFTLVELLVVIAIIAILATVSVVGYTAFIKKANKSNAMTELSQIKDAVDAAILDGNEDVEIDGTIVYFTFANNTLKAEVDGESNQKKPATQDQVEAAILKLTEMNQDLDLVAEVNATGEVTKVTYTYAESGEIAEWTIETGKIK